MHVQPLAPGGLHERGEPQLTLEQFPQVERVAAGPAEPRFVRRVEIEHELVGPIERGEAAKQRGQLGAGLVRQVHERRGLVADDMAHQPVPRMSTVTGMR